MSRGELLTRLTIWLALSGAALGGVLQFAFRATPKRQAWARWAWTVGCFGLLAHVACAYHFYHNWSQTSAYRETARQTAELFSVNWGGGLYLNYAFMAAWVVDVIWRWRCLESYQRRPHYLTLAWQGFFLFMIFNATVVFKTGALRWIGFALCIGLAAIWWVLNKPLMFTDSKGINT